MSSSDPRWPTSLPPDLRGELEGIMGQRNRPLPADVWTALRDWLIKHEVKAPEELPSDRGPEGPWN